MEGNLRDHFWGIPEGTDGKYKLTVNTQTLKLKVEKSELTPKLYHYEPFEVTIRFCSLILIILSPVFHSP